MKGDTLYVEGTLNRAWDYEEDGPIEYWIYAYDENGDTPQYRCIDMFLKITE